MAKKLIEPIFAERKQKVNNKNDMFVGTKYVISVFGGGFRLYSIKERTYVSKVYSSYREAKKQLRKLELGLRVIDGTKVSVGGDKVTNK